MVPSYRSRLRGFHPTDMSTSIRQLMKGCRRVVRPIGRCTWERHKSSTMLTVRRGCYSLRVHSGKMWVKCLSPWGCLTWAFSWLLSAFSFRSSSSCHRSISAMQFWGCWKVCVCHGCWWKVGAFERGSRLRPDKVLTMDEWETMRYVLLQPHGGCQMYLQKSRARTHQGGHGQIGLLDFTRRLWDGPLSRGQEGKPAK